MPLPPLREGCRIWQKPQGPVFFTSHQWFGGNQEREAGAVLFLVLALGRTLATEVCPLIPHMIMDYTTMTQMDPVPKLMELMVQQ